MEEKEIPKEDVAAEEKIDEELHLPIQTFKSDMDKAMYMTDASVVAKLMSDAKERESKEHNSIVRKRQKGWYTLGSFILIVLTLGAIVYGIYYYRNLTVETVERYSVGVFPSFEVVLNDTTNIEGVMEELVNKVDLPKNKPTLVSFTTEGGQIKISSNQQLFNFLETRASEPFLNVITLARLGIMNIGTETVPFVIVSTEDPQIAAKEFLIAEPNMLKMFHKALNIDIERFSEEVGGSFESSYVFNLPIRKLYAPEIGYTTKQEVLFYASVTNKVIIITTKPEVLKAVYESVIRQ